MRGERVTIAIRNVAGNFNETLYLDVCIRVAARSLGGYGRRDRSLYGGRVCQSAHRVPGVGGPGQRGRAVFSRALLSQRFWRPDQPGRNGQVVSNRRPAGGPAFALLPAD